MKTLIFLAVLALLTSCNADVHWQVTRYTATGKHTYMRPGWPHDVRCSGMYARTPIKSSTVKRMRK